MRRSVYGVLFVLFAVAVAVVAATLTAGASSSPECAPTADERPRLASGEGFEVLSAREIRLTPGTKVEIHNEAEIPFLEFSAEAEPKAVGPAVVCACDDPTVCPDDDCHWESIDGVIKCRGGCYTSSGVPCTSCYVQFATQ